jgi:cell wall-associated NlpC family hydrolase
MATAVVADAVAVQRVQGLTSSIHDLKLHDGRSLTVEVGGNIVSTPQLIRSIDTSSSIELQVYDPELRWLEKSLAAEKFDAKIDGLWFRYVGTSKQGAQMTLTLEDREVALLRELTGPKKVYAHRGQPNEVTLAEFIIGLVEAVKPKIPWVCPELEEQQPIKTERQAKNAASGAKTKRGKGLGETSGLTVAGEKATAAQLELGAKALEIAQSHGASPKVMIALIIALMDETHLGDLVPGNVLESEGSGEGAEIADAATEITNFLTGAGGYGEGGAIGYDKAHPDASPPEIATALQRNRDGAAPYARFLTEGRKWVEAFNGGTLEGSGEITVTAPRVFEVKAKGENGEPETYWDAIQRYAKAVNWRAFVSAGVFYYMDEEELSRGAVRLAILREPGMRKPVNDGIEDVDFDFHANKPISECEVTAFVEKWGVPPGAVATVAGYGPASLGPGDAPPKEKQKEAIASAVKASTHEGKGRYLAAKITVSLVGDPAVRKATVSLRKPTKPLPEGAAQTTTATVPKGSAVGNATVERMLKALENAAALKKPYVWGGEDPKTGVDCSGAVSFALRVGGFMEGRTDTEGLAGFGEAGAGQFITVYDHAHTGDPETEHCAIEVAGVVFESGGGSENGNPNGGLGKVTSGVEDFLKQFEIKRHPKGF